MIQRSAGSLPAMASPAAGEGPEEFIARCMADTEVVEDFPNAERRCAFCWAQYRKGDKLAVVLRPIRERVK